MAVERKDVELDAAQQAAELAIVAMLEAAGVSFRLTYLAGADFTVARDGVAHHFGIAARRCDVADLIFFPRYGDIFFRLWIGQNWDWEKVTHEFADARELSAIPAAHGMPEFDATRLCSLEILLDNARHWLVEWSNMVPIQPHQPAAVHAALEGAITRALRVEHYVDYAASSTRERSRWSVRRGGLERTVTIETADTSVVPQIDGGFPGRGETFFRVQLGEGAEAVVLPCDHEFALGNAVLWLVDWAPVAAIRRKILRGDTWEPASERG